jgi:hypothetical protein
MESLVIPPLQSSMNLRHSCYNAAVNANRSFNSCYWIKGFMGDRHDAVDLDNQEADGSGMVLDKMEE